MNKHILLSIFVFILCIINFGFATPLDQNFNFWSRFNINGSFKDNEQLKYFFETETRFRSNASTFRASLNRIGLGYEIDPTLTLWSGYTAIPSISSSSGDLLYGQDIFQQINWRLYSSDLVQFSTRIRLEQRKISNNRNWANRLRTNLSAIIPIKDSHVNYYIYDELFFNLDHPAWVSDRTFSQNRIFLGFRFDLKSKTRLAVGYLNQLELDSSRNSMNHTLMLALQIST